MFYFYSGERFEKLLKSKLGKVYLSRTRSHFKSSTSLGTVESSFIPLSVLYTFKHMDDDYYKVHDHVSKILFCTHQQLDVGLRNVDTIFNCSKYMNKETANLLVKKNSSNIPKTGLISGDMKISSMVRDLNGIITWSKYLPLSDRSTALRFSSINSLTEKVSA